MAVSRLAKYQSMRDFEKTAEPSGEGAAQVQPSKARRFVIQKHAASHLHFDLRLEDRGTFRSWAVPKGPSLDPADKRLAMEVEDHPLEYGDFEGTIPKGEYGGGTVMLWDRGYWEPEKGFESVGAALHKGELKFVLHGERLGGSWVLVRTKPVGRGKPSWLLIKHRDGAAIEGNMTGPTDDDRSIASGRTMAQIGAGKGGRPKPFMTAAGVAAGAVWQSNRAASGAAVSKPSAGPVRARKPAGAPLPAFIPPQLCTLAARPPSGPGWIHEIKFDGYRMQLRTVDQQASLLTRNGLDWSARYPEIVRAGAALADGIIDGEVVALDQAGAPDFAALQAVVAEGRTRHLVFFAFDQLVDGPDDLRQLPLSERKERLQENLRGAPPNIRFVEHFVDDGETVLRSACKMRLEGIVSKKLDAPYRSGRTEAWTKSKCRAGQEVVIGGWMMTGSAFRSLVAGVYRDGELHYVGRVGTGYTRAIAAQLMRKLRLLEAEKSPFRGKGAPKKLQQVHWVRPELVAEIEFEGFTADGQVRQASFKGLREDKPASEVVAERSAPAGTAGLSPNPALTAIAKSAASPVRAYPRRAATILGVSISNPDKVLWPSLDDGTGITKLELAAYYEAVGGWMLPHLMGRPCSMIRMPDGIEGEQKFFQRHVSQGQSPLITTVTVWGDRKPYLQFDRVEALVASAQAGSLELHPWQCAPFKPEEPGRLVFDLDPAPDVPFADVVAGAKEVRDRLSELGLVSFCKTTGGKGLHVVTPIAAGDIDWPTAKAFALAVCERMAADAPDQYLVNMAKKRRVGRIFLDYLRNDRMATAVAPLSPRGRPGAPVSMPIAWSQARKDLDPARYTIRTAPAALRKSKPWAEYAEAERPLAEAIRKLGGKLRIKR